jgi:hypothetical protein
VVRGVGEQVRELGDVVRGVGEQVRELGDVVRGVGEQVHEKCVKSRRQISVCLHFKKKGSVKKISVLSVGIS